MRLVSEKWLLIALTLSVGSCGSAEPIPHHSASWTRSAVSQTNAKTTIQLTASLVHAAPELSEIVQDIDTEERLLDALRALKSSNAGVPPSEWAPQDQALFNDLGAKLRTKSLVGNPPARRFGPLDPIKQAAVVQATVGRSLNTEAEKRAWENDKAAMLGVSFEEVH
jgi:hypothetical protein